MDRVSRVEAREFRLIRFDNVDLLIKSVELRPLSALKIVGQIAGVYPFLVVTLPILRPDFLHDAVGIIIDFLAKPSAPSRPPAKTGRRPGVALDAGRIAKPADAARIGKQAIRLGLAALAKTPIDLPRTGGGDRRAFPQHEIHQQPFALHRNAARGAADKLHARDVCRGDPAQICIDLVGLAGETPAVDQHPRAA